MDRFTLKIFKNRFFDKEKLLKFGFKESNNNFFYSETIIDGQFNLIICIKDETTIETKLIDSISNEEYRLHLIDGVEGKFVGQICDVYEKILKEIADKCCKRMYFSTLQANRLTEWIIKKYNDYPEFLWDKSPGCGIFRNKNNEKWYVVFLNIDYSKLDKTKKGEIEVLNIKVDKEDIQYLLKTKGFYPAYHMNKMNWITIILNGTVSDDKIKKLIDRSYILSQKIKVSKKQR